MIIQRDIYIQHILPFIDKPLIKVLTGMRRVGKSTILKMIKQHLIDTGVRQENIISINKDSLDFDFIADYKALNQFIKSSFQGIKGRCYLFIDEVQEIQNWEKALVSFLADDIADLYISGSNAHLLSSELATLLTGRYIQFRIFPLNFSEWLRFRKMTGNKAMDPYIEFDHFLKYGGFPLIHFLDQKDEIVFEYLGSILQAILLKDVVSRNAVRDVPFLERICRFSFDNCGNITTAKSIADYARSQHINVSVDLVINYLEYLQNAFLLDKVRRYDIKGRKHMSVYEKYYLGDIGLRHSLLGFKTRDISGILENIVFQELMIRGYTVSIGKVYDEEIDFIATKDQEKVYIQVAYLLASIETIDREYRSLEKVSDNFPKYVLSMDRLPVGERSGIRHRNIIDFLLSDEI